VVASERGGGAALLQIFFRGLKVVFKGAILKRWNWSKRLQFIFYIFLFL